MKEDTIDNETLDIEGTGQYNGGLPSFLNVLTILTFVGSGFGIISGIYGFTSIDQQRESIERMRELSGTDSVLGQNFTNDMIAFMEKALDNIYVLQGSALAIAVICILGAILMRSLKRTGYYLYLIASIASIVIPIVVFGFGLMAIIMMTSHLITIGFIVMYSVHLKYFK